MMKKPVFTGAAVAIITPMNADGTVNFEEFGRIIEDQIAGHTDAIVVCGTTGESATMPDAEHLSVIDYCVKKVNHRIPVIAGTIRHMALISPRVPKSLAWTLCCW